MIFEVPKREPSEHIKDTRDRFMDYIGNAQNGVLGEFSNLDEPEISKDKVIERLLALWNDFFKRVEIFRDSGFEPTDKITIDALNGILTYRDKDPQDAGVIDEFDRVYQQMIAEG